MPVKTHKDNILKQVAHEQSVSAKVASPMACITLGAFYGLSLQVCYQISGDLIKLAVKLSTPLGEIDLGSITIDPKNPKACLNGGIDSFTAEMCAEFDFSSLTLKLTAKLCAPFVGCWEGSTEIKL